MLGASKHLDFEEPKNKITESEKLQGIMEKIKLVKCKPKMKNVKGTKGRKNAPKK